ncbi:MAG TPA: putative porin [Gemmatimonadaceae bacterium]|nr:putative porin [Gemmatimonadaceae bacterium]
MTGTLRRAFVAALTASVVIAPVARAQGGNDLGSLWRGQSSPAPRVVDSSAVKKTADSVKAVAARKTADSVKAVAAKHVADSLKADSAAKRAKEVADSTKRAKDVADSVKRSKEVVTTAQLEKQLKGQADTIAELRNKISALAAVLLPPKPEPKKDSVKAPVKEIVPPTTLALAARIDSLQAAQKAAVKQTADVEKSLMQKVSGLGNFRFSGDIRVRYDGIFQSGGTQSRSRERSRARLGIGGALTDEVTALIGVATGAVEDVQSPNQTQTGFFSRKTVGFDRFYVQYKPKAVPGLSVVGGKFAYPWERTSLTFGNDINPEGIAPSWTWSRKSVFQGLSVTGFVLPLLEVAGGKDSYISGGQIQTKWKLGAHVNTRVSFTTSKITGADALAQAISAGTFKQGASATNPLRTDSAGKVLGYKGGFEYRDVLAAFEYTPRPKLPIVVQLDVVQNAAAASDAQRTGIFSDVRVGRLSQPHDVQGFWTLFRIQRDAVVGALNEQDLRAATNVMNHKAGVVYQWRSNATIGAAMWLGRLLDPTLNGKLTPPDSKTACTTSPFTGCRDPWLKRVQLDLSYKF